MREVAKLWRKIYSPFHFRLLAIAPLSKGAYPKLNPWEAFSKGCNIAAQFDMGHHIFADVDTTRPPAMIRELMKRTLSWRTPKGYCLAFQGPAEEKWYKALYAVRMADLVVDKRGFTWDRIVRPDFDKGYILRKKLMKLGLTDSLALHGLFKNIDGLSYVLLVPSTTCKYQGVAQKVLFHSSAIPLCNSSPDGKHDFVMRTFVNYTTELMDFNEFMELVNNVKL